MARCSDGSLTARPVLLAGECCVWGRGNSRVLRLTGARGTPHLHRHISARAPQIDRAGPALAFPERSPQHDTRNESTTNYCTQTGTLPTPVPAPALGRAVTTDYPHPASCTHVCMRQTSACLLHPCPALLPASSLPLYLHVVPQILTFAGSLIGDLEAVLLATLAPQQFAEAAIRAVVGAAHGTAEGAQFATFGSADAAGHAVPQPALLPFLTHVLGALSCRGQIEIVTHGKWTLGWIFVDEIFFPEKWRRKNMLVILTPKAKSFGCKYHKHIFRFFFSTKVFGVPIS